MPNAIHRKLYCHRVPSQFDRFLKRFSAVAECLAEPVDYLYAFSPLCRCPVKVKGSNCASGGRPISKFVDICSPAPFCGAPEICKRVALLILSRRKWWRNQGGSHAPAREAADGLVPAF
jgi:hypothetical protein